MPLLSYSKIPTVDQWTRDSQDVRRFWGPHSTRVDELLRAYASADPFRKLAVTSNLFFTVDYCLKVTQPRLRGPSALDALYRVIVDTLCGAFACTVNTLPRELELMFGRELTSDGVSVDFASKKAVYWTRAEADKYRLRFSDGRALQYPWWEQAPTRALVLAESWRAFSEMHSGTTFKDFGSFVMSMGREIYMTKHQPGTKGQENGVYHSSYLAGGAVMCAGTMKIEHGVVKAVRSDSGHYQPTNNNLLALLQCLQMHQPRDFAWIQVFDWNSEDDKNGIAASEFMAAAADPAALDKLRAATLRQNKAVAVERAKAALEKPKPAAPTVPKPGTGYDNEPGDGYANANETPD